MPRAANLPVVCWSVVLKNYILFYTKHIHKLIDIIINIIIITIIIHKSQMKIVSKQNNQYIDRYKYKDYPRKRYHRIPRPK